MSVIDCVPGPEAAQSEPVRVSALGMTCQARAAVETVLSRLAEGHFVLVSGDTGDVGIVDVDSLCGPELWDAERRRTPPRPVIILSWEEPAASLRPADAVAVLRKPVSANALLTALQSTLHHLVKRDSTPIRHRSPDVKTVDSATGGIHSQHLRPEEGNESKVPAASEPNSDTHFVPEHYIAGWMIKLLKLCRADGIAREVAYFDQSLRILPATDRVVTSLGDAKLRQISFLRAADYAAGSAELPSGFRVRALQQAEIGVASAQAGAALDTIIWKFAVLLARGRAPAGTELCMPIKLHRWPNFTRLPPTPHALRIAALWTTRPATLLNTAHKLNVGLSHVLTFYTATEALGLAHGGRQIEQQLVPQGQVPPVAERGVLTRLLSKLKGMLPHFQHQDTEVR